jgi:hypothetical protein
VSVVQSTAQFRDAVNPLRVIMPSHHVCRDRIAILRIILRSGRTACNRAASSGPSSPGHLHVRNQKVNRSFVGRRYVQLSCRFWLESHRILYSSSMEH